MNGRKTVHLFSNGDQFAPELVHFSNCILNDLEPEPSGMQGLADVRIMRAMIRAARTGATVKLTPVPIAKRPNMSLVMKKPVTRKIDPINAPSPSR